MITLISSLVAVAFAAIACGAAFWLRRELFRLRGDVNAIIMAITSGHIQATIRIKHGDSSKDTLPPLEHAELGWDTHCKQLWIGDSGVNVPLTAPITAPHDAYALVSDNGATPHDHGP